MYVIKHLDKYVCKTKPRRTYTKYLHKAHRFSLQAAVLTMRNGESTIMAPAATEDT